MPSPNIRIGLGYDTHRVGPGGPLRLGGLDIPWNRSLIGHSDADVLLHAITDALLGAAALGDIGRLYPDTDIANKDRDSSEMLAEAVRRVRAAEWEVANIDCVVLAQNPKIAPYIDLLCARIAEILAISADCVGLKGKTGEKVGPVGHGEAIEARCVALIYRVWATSGTA